jgi:C4-dicarboxylate-binding protein DctP
MMGRLSCALLVAILLPTGTAGAQQVRLKANLQVPLSNPFYGVTLVRFKEEVERQSKGTLMIEIFDKGQLYENDRVVDAVSSGAVDIGVTAAHNFVEKAVAAAGILDQPFLFNFAALMRTVASPESEMRRLIDEAILAETGARILWWQSLGDTMFFSRGRDVADPARLKDQRTGVTGPTNAEILARCGGKASVLPVEKFHDAIRDGTLDMVVAGLAALEGRGLWKVTDTITRTAHAALEFLLAINEKRWQSLSPSHRAVIAEAARNVERETRDRLSQFEAKAYAFASSKGIKVRDLTPDEVAEWRACSAGMIAEYMEKNGNIARRLMDAYGRLRTDPCCTAGPSTAVVFTRR